MQNATGPDRLHFNDNLFLISQSTISIMQTEIDIFANSVDPDEVAHKEHSHQDLHCHSIFDFAQAPLNTSLA